MKSLYYTVPTLALLIGLLFGAYLFSSNIANGSVSEGNDYNAVQLTSADTGTSTVKSMSGSIGSIVVASTSASGAVNLYAISSSTDPTATSSNTLIFSFPGGTTDEGTYQYDVSFVSGLLIDVESTFSGDYVLTWR